MPSELGIRQHVMSGRLKRAWRPAALLLMSGLLSACSKPAAKTATPPPPVSVARVKLADVPVELRNIGVVQPMSSVTLQPQVTGLIGQVMVKPGENVRKGEILFMIDRTPFVAALSQAKAALVQAKANVAVAIAKLQAYQAAYAAAAADWQRARKLGTTGGALAATQYDAYHSTYDQAKANVADGKASLAAARGAVASALAGVAVARINLGYCTIRSPMDGKAGNLQAYAGSSVQANTSNLLVINQMQPIYVSFSLPQRDLYQIRRAQHHQSQLPVYAAAHGVPRPRMKGFLSFINNAIDDSVGSIQLMGTFANKRRDLWPGEFVDVTLKVGVEKSAVVVPATAVQTGQKGAYVFVVKNRIAQMVPVTEAFSYRNLAVISKGLKAGETVITDGQLGVAPGEAVNVVAHGLIAPQENSSATDAHAEGSAAKGGIAMRGDRP